MKALTIKKVRVHNLKGFDISLPKHQLIVLSGVSGSGKSSLAFDTIYTEGQRRYVESLSHFARRQMGELSKPDIESAEGISPTISIEQKTAGRNPRSTVGTMTQVHDYLRVLFARIGTPYCPLSGEPVEPQSKERIIKTVQAYPDQSKIIIMAPFARDKKGQFKEDFQDLLKKGYMRVRADGRWISLNDDVSLGGNVHHNIDLVIDRTVVKPDNKSRITDSITQALQQGSGVCIVYNAETEEEELFSMHAFSPKSGLSYKSLEPQDFSFNSPIGMCPRCHGLGMINEFKLDLIIDPNKSIAKDCCSIATSHQTVRYGNIYDNLARIFGFSVNTPWKKLSQKAQDIFLYGTPEDRWLKMTFVHPVKSYVWTDRIKWKGVLHEAHVRCQEAKTERYRKKMARADAQTRVPRLQGDSPEALSGSRKAQRKKHQRNFYDDNRRVRPFFRGNLPDPNRTVNRLGTSQGNSRAPPFSCSSRTPLPRTRQNSPHPFRRGSAKGPPGLSNRLRTCRHHLCFGRTFHRPSSPRQSQADRNTQTPSQYGKYRCSRRA